MQKIIIGLVISVVVVLSGCQTVQNTTQTTDPYTGEVKTKSSYKKGGLGALTGAIIGAATSSKKDRNKGILTGALLGGAAGGYWGHMQDKQEARLRAQLSSTGVRVQRIGDNIQLIMPGNIVFGSNSDRVSMGFVEVLQSVSLILNEFNKTNIQIIGHTDSVGSDTYNQQLSERRAQSVANELLRFNVQYGRIHTMGRGERSPIAANDNNSGRQMNRRVELMIVPNG